MLPTPPIPEEIDRAVAELVDVRGLRKLIAAFGHIAPGTLGRWLNPEDHLCPSPLAQVLALLYGAHCANPDTERALWALLRARRQSWAGDSAPVAAGELVAELITKTRRNADTTAAIITALADGQIEERERQELRACLVRERAEIDRLQQMLEPASQGQLRRVR
jgi:hypothetical protein